MAAGSIQIDILANTQKLVSGMNKAEATVSKSARVMKNAMIGFAGIFLSGKLIGSINRTMQSIDKLGKTSAKLGIATDKLVGLQHGAEQSGLAVETLNMALQRSTKRISEAARGTGEAVKALQELGLSAEQLNSLSPDEQLNEIADAMLNVSSQSDKVRLSMKLFDSEGVAMVNMLKDGSAGLNAFYNDAVNLGIALDSTMVKKVEDANDAMDRLGKASGVTGQVLTIQLAPYIKIASETLIQFTKKLQTSGDGATFFGDIIQGVARAFIIGFNAMRSPMDGWNIVFKGIAVGIEYFKGNAEGLKDALSDLDGAIKTANSGTDELAKSIVGVDQVTLNLLKKLKALDTAYKHIGAPGGGAGKLTSTMETTQKAIDAVTGSLTNGLTNAFRGMLDDADNSAEAMKSMAKDVVAQLLKILVIQQSVNAIATNLGYAPTSAKRAIGGSVTAGESYLVGEQGPEMFTASSNGTISSNNNTNQGGGVTVNVVNNSSSSIGVEQNGNEINILVEQIEANIANGISRGTGIVGTAMQSAYGLSR